LHICYRRRDWEQPSMIGSCGLPTIPGKNEMKKIFRLDYPPTVIGQPVVTHLVTQFQLMINILRAQVTEEEGWLILELEGDPIQLAAAKAWLLAQGLDITENPPLEDSK
jgi:L-aspartate semialdehyde sulfurtransferase ferredoxin